MIEILFKGIGIGFAVAAPVGPIGLLCVKRTLEQGRAMGLATGLGAAAADAGYGVMVAAGLSLSGVLLAYAQPLQLVGGLLIVWLGLLSLRRYFRPKGVPHTARAPKTNRLAVAFGSSFLLTLSNPMTILAFVALISGLGASTANTVNTAYVLVAGVFFGSALWWFLLVGITALARSRLPDRAMGWLDLLSGGVLVIWGLWIAYGTTS